MQQLTLKGDPAALTLYLEYRALMIIKIAAARNTYHSCTKTCRQSGRKSNPEIDYKFFFLPFNKNKDLSLL